MHYHDKGYGSDIEYGLPAQGMRPVQIYSVSTTEFFNLESYKEAQYTTSAFTPRGPRDDLPFCERVLVLMFDETPPPTAEVDCDDEDYHPTADLDDLVWMRNLCQIGRNTCVFISHLIDIPEEIHLDFDVWAHSVLEIQW